jgi:hypothetical protein
MLKGPRLNRLRGNVSTPLLWPTGLMTCACLLFFVLLAGGMVVLGGRLRAGHFFSNADQECRAVAAYAKTLSRPRVNPVLSDSGYMSIIVEGEGALPGLDCTRIFETLGLETVAGCDPKLDPMCQPFDVVFGRPLLNSTKYGFTLNVDYPCSGLCGSGYEVDFLPAKNGWRAVSARQMWIS